MEIKSSLERKTITSELLTIMVAPKDRDTIVEVLQGIMDKAKVDRFEKYVVTGLIEALQQPASGVAAAQADPVPVEQKEGFKTAPLPQEKPVQEAVSVEEMVQRLKNRIDPRGEKTMAQWIKESVEFGQKQIGIKTAPKSLSVKDYFDWLVESKIVDQWGNPIGGANRG